MITKMSIEFFIGMRFIFAVFLAIITGMKRHIGFGWSFCFYFLFSILVGYFIVSSSPLLQNNKTTPNKKYHWIGNVLIAMGIIPLLIFISNFLKNSNSPQFSYTIGLLSTSFIGITLLGIYIRETHSVNPN
jgi:protein-S-isoprenylcysteine O-methyltransferase Ste14